MVGWTFSNMAYLRLITTKLPVAVRKTLQANGELDVTTTHNVLQRQYNTLNSSDVLLLKSERRGRSRDRLGGRGAVDGPVMAVD
jgi:hypothetical protein